MKNILIAAAIAGAVGAAVVLYLKRRDSLNGEIDDVEDAAADAYHTMNRHINKTESAFDPVL